MRIYSSPNLFERNEEMDKGWEELVMREVWGREVSVEKNERRKGKKKRAKSNPGEAARGYLALAVHVYACECAANVNERARTQAETRLTSVPRQSITKSRRDITCPRHTILYY